MLGCGEVFPDDLSDDEHVPRLGLRLTRVEVDDSTHCETGEISDKRTLFLGEGNGERADRGGLVDDPEWWVVFSQSVQYVGDSILVFGNSINTTVTP